MKDGDRRKLVFTNLVNGVPVPSVMEALYLSEKEVMDDFWFVARKIRSYRFERGKPLLPIDSIVQARNQRIELLLTMSRLNLETPAAYRQITSLPFTPDGGGGMSDAERAMHEMKMRAGAK
jgi:hypothetical protein